MFEVKLEAAQAAVKAALLQLLIIANDDANGLTEVSATVVYSELEGVSGDFTVGYTHPDGGHVTAIGGSL